MKNKETAIWNLLESIHDPEIPVLSIIDLGIIRFVSVSDLNDEVLIQYSPTYSACPAVEMINTEIKIVLERAGFKNVRLEQKLFPAWSTDWMTAAGKEKLTAYGIAAPVGKTAMSCKLEELMVTCPQCGSKQTKLISEFSSTACKALFSCIDCLEPFDYFKCH